MTRITFHASRFTFHDTATSPLHTNSTVPVSRTDQSGATSTRIVAAGHLHGDGAGAAAGADGRLNTLIYTSPATGWDRPRCATTARWTRRAGTPKVLGAATQRLRPGDEPERTGVHWHVQRQRKCHRVFRLARTIADQAGSERIQPAHIAEAIHLRSAAETRVTRVRIHRQSETNNPMTRAEHRSRSFGS